MGYTDIGITGGCHRVNMQAAFATFSLAGATQSKQVKPATAIQVALLQAQKLTDHYAPNETWAPMGLACVVSTTITITIPALTLQKNGVAAATGGVATFPSLLAASVNEVFIPFTSYTFAAADAIGDTWSVLVTTTATAGVLNELWLVYGYKTVGGVGVGVTL